MRAAVRCNTAVLRWRPWRSAPQPSSCLTRPWRGCNSAWLQLRCDEQNCSRCAHTCLLVHGDRASRRAVASPLPSTPGCLAGCLALLGPDTGSSTLRHRKTQKDTDTTQAQMSCTTTALPRAVRYAMPPEAADAVAAEPWLDGCAIFSRCGRRCVRKTFRRFCSRFWPVCATVECRNSPSTSHVTVVNQRKVRTKHHKHNRTCRCSRKEPCVLGLAGCVP